VPLAQGKEPPADLAKDKVDNGQKEVPSSLLDTFAVGPDNIDDTVVKEGFLKTEDICTAKYKSACQKAGLE
jgi:D-xylose transport system substrate-binding protein